MTKQMIEKIREHYEHARIKHPYFCDSLIPSEVDVPSRDEIIATNLAVARHDITSAIANGSCYYSVLLNCEVWEINEAVANGNVAAAIEESYDAIAILLRVVDVLEGRQKLGNNESLNYTTACAKKCPRCKTGNYMCEYYSANGDCHAICYPTDPPQYDKCVYLAHTKGTAI